MAEVLNKNNEDVVITFGPGGMDVSVADKTGHSLSVKIPWSSTMVNFWRKASADFAEEYYVWTRKDQTGASTPPSNG